MKCHEARHRLDLFMDGELSVAENLPVLEHLNLCRSCAVAYEGEKALRTSLKERLGSEKAPPGLADRALALARSAGARPPASSVIRRGRLAAAALLLFVAGAVLLTSSSGGAAAFAAQAAVRHDATRRGFCGGTSGGDCVCFCAGCCKEGADSLPEFWKRFVSHAVCAHDLSPLGYRPIGASVWNYGGKPVCWTVYRDDRGRTLSHGLVCAPVAVGSRPVRVDDPRPVVLVPARDGRTCAFLFDDPGEADRVVAFLTGRP